MPTINPNTGKVEYAGGEAMPAVGTPEYTAAQQGKILPPGSPPTPKIVGSNDPLIGKQTLTGMQNAGNAITTPAGASKDNQLVPGSYVDPSGKIIKPGDSGYVSPGMSGVYNKALEGTAEAVQTAKLAAERLMSVQNLAYNTDLAASNAKYAALHDELKTKLDHSLQVAQQNAISLNPYSTSRGATVAENFKGRLVENYNAAAASLERQADLAQKELAAGNYKSYVEIQNNLSKVISDVAQKNDSLLIDFTKTVEAAKQFDSNQKNVWADNFRQQLTSIALDPKTVDDMVKSGSIYNDPTYQAGVRAGFSPEGVIDSMKAGSLALKKAQDLEIYRAAQLALQNERLIASQDKMTAAQMASAAASRVNNTHIDLTSKGIKYGTPDYAEGIARASQGGTKPSQADRDRYGALDAVASSLDRIKTDIYALGDNNQLWNIVNTATKNPGSSEVTKFNAQLAGVATQIARSIYGEKGSLSDGDVARILSSVGNGYQKENVREGLFNELLKKVVDAGTTKMISDANAGVDVSNYAYTIKSIQDKISSASKDTTGTTYKGFTLPY